MRAILKKIIFICSLMGFNPIKFLSLRFFPRFFYEFYSFKKKGGKVNKIYPILDEYAAQAGSAKGHYFHQDLLVASLVYKNNPIRHIDIGSRIDGFVAHVASFRKIEVIDIRTLENVGHDNIAFVQADLMNISKVQKEVSDSISCLHAIEHFGLGRYGDPLDPQGHIKGFNNIIKMLSKNGLLYISFPIGKETSIQFNAHRVFHPREILTWSDNNSRMELIDFHYVDDKGDLNKNFNLNTNIPDVSYGCGIYVFKKSL